jgi:hypothetical protein
MSNNWLSLIVLVLQKRTTLDVAQSGECGRTMRDQELQIRIHIVVAVFARVNLTGLRLLDRLRYNPFANAERGI